MKKIVTTLLLACSVGCYTQADLVAAKSKAQQAATVARVAIADYKAGKTTIDKVIGAVAAVTPETGTAHAIAIDAMTAATLLSSNESTVDAVDAKLALIEGGQAK